MKPWTFFVILFLTLLGSARMSAKEQIRYLALGDSYTFGEGVSESDRYPVRLAEQLRKRGVSVAAPVIVARSGWTTDELSSGIDAAHPKGPFDLVSLLIGTNNQFRGRSADEYRTQFGALLKRAIAFAGNNPRRVIVFSMPDWGATPYARGQNRERIGIEIELFNTINRDEARRANARYIDITEKSRAAATDPSQVGQDGLHPSGRMYEEWARLALPQAVEALSK